MVENFFLFYCILNRLHNAILVYSVFELPILNIDDYILTRFLCNNVYSKLDFTSIGGNMKNRSC